VAGVMLITGRFIGTGTLFQLARYFRIYTAVWIRHFRHTAS
jgi:hypothetical protein